jgi:hypothetical protein
MMGLIQERVEHARRLSTFTKQDRKDEHRSNTKWCVDVAIYAQVNKEDLEREASIPVRAFIPVPELPYQPSPGYAIRHFVNSFTL